MGMMSPHFFIKAIVLKNIHLKQRATEQKRNPALTRKTVTTQKVNRKTDFKACFGRFFSVALVLCGMQWLFFD
jgi:hypothetical protein